VLDVNAVLVGEFSDTPQVIDTVVALMSKFLMVKLPLIV
jgi:hypothetical protein